MIGAACALGGCLFGNFLAASFILSHHDLFSVGNAFEGMKEMASPMDFLFYGIAVYEGWKFGGGGHSAG